MRHIVIDPDNPYWNRNTPTTTTPEEAMKRLEAMLHDKLLWFNPYRVHDRTLLECSERGYWLTFPSITQMLVFHFHDIRVIHYGREDEYSGFFYHIGNDSFERHLGVCRLTHTLTHRATRRPVWTLLNGLHIVCSNIEKMQSKIFFVSHAIPCDRRLNELHQAYRFHRLYGPEARRAKIIRESMIEAKLIMLEEVLQYSVLPEYLGNPCLSVDIATPILQAMAAIRRFPESTPPTTHIISR